MRTEAESRPKAEKGHLRLRAIDAADMQILSAALQDAVVPLADMAYLSDDRIFVMVVNRFRWEDRAVDDRRSARVLCGVSFAGVEEVRRKNVTEAAVDGFLNLLSVEVDTPASGSTTIELCFAGGAGVRLLAHGVDCRLEDIGEAWPTQWRPDHS